MKRSILALGLALAIDGALYWSLHRISSVKKDLEGRRDDLGSRVEALRETDERERRSEALVRRASRSMGRLDRTLDIAELRDSLIAAERGLDIDRISLDFRPAADAAKGREGGRVSANLGGSFDAVHGYLDRIEGLRLPLVAEAFSLRADDSGRVLLSVDWTGLWGLPDRTLEELSSGELAQLESWLAMEREPLPGRNPFSVGEAPGEEPLPALIGERPPQPEPSIPSPPQVESPTSPPPRLTGFVIARAELETDIDRRVLAALRFEGELRLVGLGDVVGSYRVEEIEARESVLLVHEESGERLKLYLE